ncbi:MAG TPA: monovalent cation/H(+) antiporter subunit G [Mycobacterium sp.]|jgi:multicomponent Na+:H+ antiporter subunit G
MSEALVVVEWVLVTAGCLVIVVSTVAALLLTPVFDRLHAVSAVSTAGAPLVGLGIAISEGFSTATLFVIVTVAVVVAAGPVLGAATARMAAQRKHLIEEDEPQ